MGGGEQIPNDKLVKAVIQISAANWAAWFMPN